MGQTLYEKVFDRHIVREVTAGQYQLAADLHFLNEVSSPQAFEALRERGLRVRHPGRTFGSADHSISTGGDPLDFVDPMAAEQVEAMGRNMAAFGLTYFDPSRGEHGIVHVVAPERGLTQPGMVIVCGDSHTSTHGAFGAIAFGIGTSQVRDVLASQTLLMEKLKVRRVEITGRLAPGVYAKDVALHVIHVLGAKGGVGFAYEFGGAVVDGFSMEERMTLCNLAIEGGARCGYVNPDQTTYDYLRGRDHAPQGAAWDEAMTAWEQVRSDRDAAYDDVVVLRGEDIQPMVTWGVSPDQSVPVGGAVPDPTAISGQEQGPTRDVLDFMGLRPAAPIAGTRIDVAFIGSCTNGRVSDFEAVADQLRGRGLRVAPHVRALAVPGSRRVREALIAKGIDKVLIEAGFDFRDTGCSLCCGMNADSLKGQETCASSSNRNFRGRQGSPTGRTMLMSPVMVAAAAIAGEVTDARRFFAQPTEPGAKS
ncbi:MAG TPA: 3-isopropylmalate dehydratase large subunit [Rhodopila sp.]|uniref:3-isopropylmalate dehydratase large subunit n=1 Tax=Rhodopila sp. TaxID=2480087 RepID=UPI002C934B47|nr:3-isopropylmalate dehydratase large subunit [Rhodopila sp.]HVY15276.1 3-isopropylmalate dehydratase large subunit [Rhodopila sp.]